VSESTPGAFKIGDYRVWIVVKVVHVNMLSTSLTFGLGYPPIDQTTFAAFCDAVRTGLRDPQVAPTAITPAGAEASGLSLLAEQVPALAGTGVSGGPSIVTSHGDRQTVFCEGCGTGLEASAKFCSACAAAEAAGCSKPAPRAR
jgi:hypothetical protein